jgi:nucleoside-diphosphate-sugar epimerase
VQANGQVVEPSTRGPVLVTGGTGFLGEHLLRALRGRGQAVRVLTREPTAELRELGVSVYQGDLLSDSNRVSPEAAKAGQDEASSEAWIWHSMVSKRSITWLAWCRETHPEPSR